MSPFISTERAVPPSWTLPCFYSNPEDKPNTGSGEGLLHLFLVFFFNDNEMRGVQLVAIYNHKTARAKFSISFVKYDSDICACVCLSNESLTVGKQIMRSVVTL